MSIQQKQYICKLIETGEKNVIFWLLKPLVF